MEEGEEKKFKVVDRRRFDSDGNESSKNDDDHEGERHSEPAPSGSGTNGTRAEVQPQKPQASAKPVEPRPEPKREQKSASKLAVSATPETEGAETSEQAGGPEISFASFAMSLGTQALMLMGEMQAPGGRAIPRDVEGARQTIEILAMLQEKTKGNLDHEESYLLEEILHNLRLAFLRHA